MTASGVAALEIRPACAGDLDRLAWLEEAAFADSWPPQVLAFELIHPRALVLVAARAGEPPAGYACFRQVAGEAELLRVGVDPAERRRGVAFALVRQGLERLAREGVTDCFLEVRTGNEAALGLYRRLGFAAVGRRRGYYRDGTDALILARPLAP